MYGSIRLDVENENTATINNAPFIGNNTQYEFGMPKEWSSWDEHPSPLPTAGGHSGTGVHLLNTAGVPTTPVRASFSLTSLLFALLTCSDVQPR